MDIKHFITFKSIVDSGSFSNAADKLGYAQSTVTSHIQQLEVDLGTKLFEKLGRKMILTNAGKKLLPLTNDLINLMEKIDHIGKDVYSLTGELRIAAPESLLIYKLEPILREFREKAPEIKISILNSNCYDIKRRLIKGEVEIALLYVNCNENDSLITRPLADIPLIFVSSPGMSPSTINLDINNKNLGTSILVNEPDSIYRNIFVDYLKKKNIIFDNIIELWSIESIKQCVKSGLGIALLPEITVEQDLQSHQLQSVSTDSGDLSVTAYLAFHKNKWITPAMDLFLTIVEKYFSSQCK